MTGTSEANEWLASKIAALETLDKVARAAATDAGNRRMRSAGRKAWSVDDYNAAVREYERLAIGKGE